MIDVAVSGRFKGVIQPTGTHRSAALLFAVVKRLTPLTVETCLPIGHAASSRRSALAAWQHVWEQFVFPYETQANVLLSLLGTGPVFHRGRSHCMVVHDLNYAIVPHVYGKAFRTWYRFACGVAAQRADVVVCFTNYVRGTIQERLGIPIDRIRVIPQGPGLSGLDAPRQIPSHESCGRPYFLCVGSLQPHKNLTGVLAAWEIFRQRHGGFSLKVVGRAQDNFASLNLDVGKLPPDVDLTGYISDEELIGLYRGATGFLYPSIEEGFGLPVVESFYCGCPVVTSNRSCLPEVAGDAAILVDPHNSAAIAEAMALLAQQSATAQSLRLRGFERAKLFTWEKAGRQMASILEEASAC